MRILLWNLFLAMSITTMASTPASALTFARSAFRRMFSSVVAGTRTTLALAITLAVAGASRLAS